MKDKRPVACLVRSAANPSVQSGQTIIKHLFQSRETITEHLYKIHWVKSFPTASKTTVTITITTTTTTIIKHQYKIHCVKSFPTLFETCKSIVRLQPCSPITVTGPPWAEEWRTWVLMSSGHFVFVSYLYRCDHCK